MPDTLETALRALYDSYRRRFDAWQQATDDGTPPVFIVVCSNTTVSNWVLDWIAGYERDGVAVPGELPLFSNVGEDGRMLHRPRAIRVDSAQLEKAPARPASIRRRGQPLADPDPSSRSSGRS